MMSKKNYERRKMFPKSDITKEELIKARRIAKKLKWTKSSPRGKYKDTPHEYAWRAYQPQNEPLQVELAKTIERYAMPEKFFKVYFNYLYLGDGYKYWLCGNVENNDFLINRCDESKTYDI